MSQNHVDQLRDEVLTLVERSGDVRANAVVHLRSKNVWGEYTETLAELIEKIGEIRLGGVGSDGSYLLVATVDSSISITDETSVYEGEPLPPEPDWGLRSIVTTTTETDGTIISGIYDGSQVDKITTGSMVSVSGTAYAWDTVEIPTPQPEHELVSIQRLTDSTSATVISDTYIGSRVDKRTVGSAVRMSHTALAWDYTAKLPSKEISLLSSTVSVLGHARITGITDTSDGSYAARVFGSSAMTQLDSITGELKLQL